MSDWPWVIAAYTLTWVVLGVYSLRIRGRISRARAELEAGSHPTGSSLEAES